MSEQRPFVHAGLAMMVAKRYWIEGEDLDDLYQIACEAIWRAEPGYDGTKGSRSTYLHRVARNEIGKLLQRRRTKMRTPPTGGVSSLEDPIGDGEYTLGDNVEAIGADPARIVEARDELDRALHEPSLSPGERVCVYASALGLQASDVGFSKQLATNARAKIRAADAGLHIEGAAR